MFIYLINKNGMNDWMNEWMYKWMNGLLIFI